MFLMEKKYSEHSLLLYLMGFKFCQFIVQESYALNLRVGFDSMFLNIILRDYCPNKRAIWEYQVCMMIHYHLLKADLCCLVFKSYNKTDYKTVNMNKIALSNIQVIIIIQISARVNSN